MTPELHLFQDSRLAYVDIYGGGAPLDPYPEGHSPACWCNPDAAAADSIVFDGSLRWAPLPEEP